MNNVLRKSAQNQQCFVRLPGVCSFNPEQTVLAHLPSGYKGLKSHDLFGSFCCYECHQVLDGHKQSLFTKEYLQLSHLQGVIRTQEHWIREGLIKIIG